MAKRRFRVEGAGLEDTKGFIQALSPYSTEALDLLESGDTKGLKKLLDSIGKHTPEEKASLTSQFQQIQSKLPTRPVALRQYIDQLKDTTGEAALTDEELQTRLGAYKEIGGLSPETDRAVVERDISSKLANTQNISLSDKSILTPALVDFIMRGRRLPSAGELSGELESKNVTAWQGVMENAAVTNFLNDQDNKNYFANLASVKPPDTSADQTRIQEILNSRMSETQKLEALNQFLVETPEELRQSRESYLATQEELGGQYLRERAIPNVLVGLNRRGTIESPSEVASGIAYEAGGIQSRIEEQARSLASEDDIFFADAAFRLKTSRLESSELDYRTQVAAERTRVRGEQGQGFADRKGQLSRDFDADMLRRESERNLRLRRSELDFSSGAAADATRSSLLSDVASSGGSIIGSKLIYGDRPKSTKTPSETAANPTPAPAIKPVPSIIGR